VVVVLFEGEGFVLKCTTVNFVCTTLIQGKEWRVVSAELSGERRGFSTTVSSWLG
jgi:hypothetical protein